VQPFSHITISLYAKKALTTDILIGREEITCEPQHGSYFFETVNYISWLSVLHEELDVVLGSTGGHVGEPAIVLTISMSANASSSLIVAVNTPNPKPAETAAAERGITSGAPVEPVVDNRTKISHTLDHAEEAMDTVKTWKSTVNVIKCVMDTIGPIADVCPILFFLALPSQLFLFS
jgi:hypothetical protein